MPDKIIIPVHQWTNAEGDVLVVRFVDHECKSHPPSGIPFQHPKEVGESVTAPDWETISKCGGGIHGWPWAMWLGSGKDPQWDALWQVYAVKPSDIVLIEENSEWKIKFRSGRLVFLGAWNKATDFVLSGQMAWVAQASSGAGHATGDSSASSATGDSSASSATGYSSASSATGDSSASSATGDSSASVCTGLGSKARAGNFGCIALAWLNNVEKRVEMRCALVGPGNLKPDVWYCLNEAGEFVEAEVK